MGSEMCIRDREFAWFKLMVPGVSADDLNLREAGAEGLRPRCHGRREINADHRALWPDPFS